MSNNKGSSLSSGAQHGLVIYISLGLAVFGSHPSRTQISVTHNGQTKILDMNNYTGSIHFFPPTQRV